MSAGDEFHFHLPPFEPVPLRDVERLVSAFDFPQLLGLLLVFSSQSQQTNQRILEELKKMTDQEQQLTDAVTAVVSEFDAFTDAVKAELASLSSTVVPTTDPVVTTSIGNLNTLAANMKLATATALAAIPPVTSPTTPVVPTSSTTPTSSTAPTEPIATTPTSTPVTAPVDTTTSTTSTAS